MDRLERLGLNIQSLRNAYGETQEELGLAISVEKNTVSNYEKAKREPNKDILVAIANHYMVSVEELLHGDFTSIGKISIDKNALWQNIEIFLPIISSEKALLNDNFRKAVDAHRVLYNHLHLLQFDMLDCANECSDGYMSVIEDNELEAMASANLIALWFLMLYSLKAGPEVMKRQPAALKQVIKNDEKAKKEVENYDSSFEGEAKAALREFYASSLDKMILQLLNTVKKSQEWSDVADYYLALQFIWNLVDNDLDWGFNQRIGIEMMRAFVSVKNKYATRFTRLSM